MSKDKRKKLDRAYAFIRAIRTRSVGRIGVNPYGYWGKGAALATVTGPLPAVVRYCLRRGLATLRRTKRGAVHRGGSRHNLLDAE